MPEQVVGLVLVSHSASIADGLADLVRQMAPDVTIEAAGGMEDGGLGTSYDLISAAFERAAGDGRSVVVLTDLGSAVLTVESVIDMEDLADRVLMADAPLVEGAVAAGVAAQGGAGAAGVRDAAEGSVDLFERRGPDGPDERDPADPQEPAPADPGPEPGSGAARATVVLRNRLGLHARPAAVLARLASGFGARVTIDAVDATSVLALMTLGIVGGQEVVVEAVGPGAQEALDAVVAEIESGFGET